MIQWYVQITVGQDPPRIEAQRPIHDTAHASGKRLEYARQRWSPPRTSATRQVVPVTQLDGRAFGTGKPGPVWRRVFEQCQALKKREAA